VADRNDERRCGTYSRLVAGFDMPSQAEERGYRDWHSLVPIYMHEQSILRRIMHNHKDYRPLPPSLLLSTISLAGGYQIFILLISLIIGAMDTQ
jgi:hypothetical protein